MPRGLLHLRWKMLPLGPPDRSQPLRANGSFCHSPLVMLNIAMECGSVEMTWVFPSARKGICRCGKWFQSHGQWTRSKYGLVQGKIYRKSWIFPLDHGSVSLSVNQEPNRWVEVMTFICATPCHTVALCECVRDGTWKKNTSITDNGQNIFPSIANSKHKTC